MRFFSYDGNNNFVIQSQSSTMEISKDQAFQLYQLMMEKLMPIARNAMGFEQDHEDYWPSSSEDDGA